MPSVTLAESAKLAQDDLVAGIIENIITVNRMFDVLPFDGIEGNSLAYNRENALGAVASFGVGQTIGAGGTTAKQQAAKNAATFTQVNSNLTSIIGDAEVNGLIQATRSGDGNDQKAVQIASKAKATGREYQRQFISGDSGIANENEFDGLLNLVAGSQTVASSTNGDQLTFEKLDELLSLVTDKDGVVDFLTMNVRELNKYFSLLRGLGGAGINETVQLPSGEQVPGYRGVPIFRNDYIPIDRTQGSSTNASVIFAGTLDDGSRNHGLAGLTASNMAGINVVDVGESETKDESITRIKWYSSVALFSEKGLAMLDGIIP